MTGHGPTRRRMLGLLGAAAGLPALGGLAGCAGLTGSGGEGSGSGTITLAYNGDASQQAAFNALFAAFHRAHPNITVKANGIAAPDWATFSNTIITQLAGGKKYDIIDVATEGQALMSSKNVLQPLDAYIAEDRAVVDAYYAGIAPQLRRWTREFGSPDGKTYFIPGGYNTVVLYCNTEVFAKAGVDLPEAGWTWTQFRDAGRRIKARTGAFLTTLGDGTFPFADIMPWLLTNGASTLSADWSKATLGSDAAVEAATFVKSLIDDKLVPQVGGTYDAIGELGKGNVATTGGGRYLLPAVKDAKLVSRLRIVEWPHNVRPGSPAGWDGFPILKTSDNRRAAWTFIKWLMTAQAGRFYAQQGGTNIPALRSIATSTAFLDGAPAGSRLLPEAIGYATPIPSPVQGGLVQVAITTGWRNAITGLQPPQRALAGADAQIGPLL